MNDETRKPTVIPQGCKWCPGCTAVLPATSFGPDRSRPPLYLQGRCRSCVTQANKRSLRLDWSAEFAEVIRGIGGLPASHILVVPFQGGRGRKRVTVHPESAQLAQNWRDTLDGYPSRKKDPAEVTYFPERIQPRGQCHADWPENWEAWAATQGACVNKPLSIATE